MAEAPVFTGNLGMSARLMCLRHATQQRPPAHGALMQVSSHFEMRLLETLGCFSRTAGDLPRSIFIIHN
jgi:hypothetical protein